MRLSDPPTPPADSQPHRTNGTAPAPDTPRGIPLAAEFEARALADPGDGGTFNFLQASPVLMDVEPLDDASGEAQASVGIHELLKGVDVWFSIEVQQMEGEARRLAAEWAAEGLPHHHVERDEPLEPETQLAAKAAELFSQWLKKVRTRVEDAAEEETQRVAASLGAFRRELELLDAGRRALAAAGTRMEEWERHARARAEERREAERRMPSHIAYRGHFGWYWFWPMMILLVAADFIANVPVFSELLPTNPTAERVMSGWEQDAVDLSPFVYGVKSLGARMLVHPEASILALSVIVFFVFLGHTFGGALRTLVALRGADQATAAAARFQRRRPWVAFVASGIGIIAMMLVLFMARSLTEERAGQRLAQAEAAYAVADSVYQDAVARRDLSAIAPAAAARDAARELLDERTARHDYTVAIATMNWPVAGLNLVLIIAAMVAAYHRQSESVELYAVPREDPVPTDPREALRARVLEHRQRLRQIAVDIETGLGRVHHLLQARPLHEWTGKAERLGRVIQIFRGENARLRHMDPWTILAFRRESPLHLPVVDPSAPFRAPERLPRLTEEFDGLRTEYRKIDALVSAGFGDAVTGGAA